ncbi:hypothetical protein BDP27DRAFT_1226672, partial [Rhodocollybia butyracea]
FPTLIAQVDQMQKGKVFETDVRRHMESFGTISIEEFKVVIDESFRAMDYGMRKCELRLSLPPILDQSESTLFGDSFPLSLYRLNATAPLNPRKLNYLTRPQRMFKLSDLPVQSSHGNKNGSILWTRSFSCGEEEVMTFELACSGLEETGCSTIEWWQNKQSFQPGKKFSLS